MVDLQSLTPALEHTIEFAARQVRALVTTAPEAFPMYTTHGQWSLQGERWTNWCEGFLGGQLWLLAQSAPSGRGWFAEKAVDYSRLVEHRKSDTAVHDLGFVFLPTWKRWYDRTGDQALQAVVVEAGRTLARRFQARGKYLASFLGTNSLFIDIMMNVPIIFYAAQVSGDEALWQVAAEHCDTTRRFLVRGDGSTLHEGIFDLNTGEFLRPSTQQGWRADSCWARGLAWSIYGFVTVYGYTKNPADLATAQLNADYYLAHTPRHGVPPNDYDEPRPARPYESSAAAVAAGGLWNLARLTADPDRAAEYQQAALRIMTTLTSSNFLADQTPNWQGVLMHGSYHERKNLGVDESVMWGEYFFLETTVELFTAAQTFPKNTSQRDRLERGE